MSSTVLVVATLGGLVAVARWVARAWAAERPPRLSSDGGSIRFGRVGPTLRRAAALSAAAMVAGVLVLGAGLRLMMRIAAATSPDAAQGRLTDAEEVVGEVTLGGTLFFVVGVGLIVGMGTMAAWLVLRPWLPRRSAVAGVTLAAIGGGAFARPSGLVDAGNRDFAILSPAWLAVALTLAVLLAYGVTFAVLADSWASTWPNPGPTPRGIAAVAPFLVLFGMSILLVVPAVIIALVTVAAAWPRPRPDRAPARHRRIEPVGRAVVGAVAVAGVAWVGFSAIEAASR